MKMNKIIGALALATGLFACASNPVNYSASQFSNENYSRNMANSIEYADSFVDFDQRHIPQASLDATDFSILLSADVSYNQNSYAPAALNIRMICLRRGDDGMVLMIDVNIVNVVIAAIVSFVVGMVWFSPALFGKKWIKLMKFTDAQMKAAKMKGMGMMYGKALVSSLRLQHHLISGE